jgi:hypothetical protein
MTLPNIEKKYDDNESNLISVIKQNLKELDDGVTNIILKPYGQQPAEQMSPIPDVDNDRNKPNVYSPQLSPEIGFCNVEKDDNDASLLKYKKLNRKTLKKKVSFHDEPSYIPETTMPKKNDKNDLQSFVTSVHTELNNVNAALIAAKKVNVNPREKFVPANQTRVQPSRGSPPSPPSPPPQRLSTKLLDMFQQKQSIAQPQNTVLLSKPSSTCQTSTQPLVHVSAPFSFPLQLLT